MTTRGLSLSILLQGPLFAADAPALADRCHHWRAFFPSAPLILAISQTDLPGAHQPGALERRDVAPTDATTRHALDSIWRGCDEIWLAAPAEALPPVKRGLVRNNVNLQIAAARVGLPRVATDHVLRIRHDMLVVGTRIVDDYLAGAVLPRTDRARFADRIMISPWFTLNPMTLERLPYHFSDWFHLGRTADVRALWNVAPMTAADARFYARHARAPGAGRRECAFRSRFAAEQHLIRGALMALGHAPPLDRHDDPAGADASLQLLADDFVIADLADDGILFEKYRHLETAGDLDLVCVTPNDWQRLVLAQGEVPPAKLFADKIARADAIRRREAAAWWSPRR